MPSSSIDLDLIAQRILTLAEIATLDHLELLLRSQAHDLVAQADADPEETPREI